MTAILPSQIQFLKTLLIGNYLTCFEFKLCSFDIRKNTGSTPYYFAKYITSQKRAFYKAIEIDLDYPGRFIWTRARQIGDDKLKYPKKVILLVDENCQSQREFTAMCLQIGDNVTTIGNQTAGADGNVCIFNMVGGYKTQFSGVGIFYPDGTETQRKGVKIDIIVKPTNELPRGRAVGVSKQT